MKKMLVIMGIAALIIPGMYAGEGCPVPKAAGEGCKVAAKQATGGCCVECKLSVAELTKVLAEQEAALAQETDAAKKTALEAKIAMIKKMIEAKQAAAAKAEQK